MWGHLEWLSIVYKYEYGVRAKTGVVDTSMYSSHTRSDESIDMYLILCLYSVHTLLKYFVHTNTYYPWQSWLLLQPY